MLSLDTDSRKRLLSESIVELDGLTVVDAGLDFNLPFPPLLRPERQTDIFIAFDFSWYGSEEMDPFKVGCTFLSLTSTRELELSFSLSF